MRRGVPSGGPAAASASDYSSDGSAGRWCLGYWLDWGSGQGLEGIAGVLLIGVLALARRRLRRP